MNLKEILLSIENFKITQKTENYEISDFFDEIGEKLNGIIPLNELKKKQLIKGLFDFLKTQNPEMSENFSFIHLIECIDKPNYEIYNSELTKFNSENGTITSTLLLNRHINSLKGKEWEKNLEFLKTGITLNL